MKKLPIGIQSFEELRKNDYLYIDKTEDIHRLITVGKYYFLTRPRRFGKSLTLSTIKQVYSGKKELFKDLWIEDKWDWTQKNPVIHLSFNSLGHKNIGLEKALEEEVNKKAGEFSVKLNQSGIARRFQELIEKISENGKVVILIDEYDKPILDYLGKDQHQQAYANRDILKSFYSVLKPLDSILELVLITGVSKFTKTGIFSELNNLLDITLSPNFGTLCGYTEAELHHYFKSYAPKDAGIAYWGKVKEWYNGYSWDSRNRLYNPFSILSHFFDGQFMNYWFATGTPTFLINLLKERFYYEFDGVEVGMTALESHDIETIATDSLLFQTGYLTLKDRDDEFGTFTLGYPNKEVKVSMLQHLIGAFSYDSNARSTPIVKTLNKAFKAADLKEVIRIVNGLFKSIPSQIFIKDKEAYYHSLIYLTFYYLGQYIDAEVNTSDGRIDAVVQTKDHIFILEFKLDKSADIALQQIQEKGYAEKYMDASKKVLTIGVNFDSIEKKVTEWKVVDVSLSK